jgi:outer membrane receptor protein involved in Fe transport
VKYLAVAAVFLATGNLAAQNTATVRGRITDQNGAAVAGAQVVISNLTTGTQNGGVTGADGVYNVTRLRAGGPYRIEVRMIGYGLEAEDNVVLAAGQTETFDFQLGAEAVALDALDVFATRAVERQTPVAFSNVPKAQIQNQLGSQDLPMVMNSTPAVYATMQGGGAGDARINVRGFDQKNIGVMINGVPVNDMENGWVYWSNWDGLGDAATSIQLQRGLSAVNLATPSIGGTLNVITDPTARSAGLNYKQEFGTAGFLKETLLFDTGLLGDRFALTGSVVRKTGDGRWKSKSPSTSPGDYNDGLATYTDAWAYYLAAAYQINPRNRIELYAVGAPQKHGQNLYKLNVATMDHDFARELGFTQAALDAFPEAGRFWSPNVNVVRSSYTGEQYASSGPGAGTFERHGSDYLNERENFFHKPQVNLNYYADLGNGLSWTTVGYYSGGNGGGSGTIGSLVWDYSFTQRFADWNATIDRNQASSTGSTGILRASVNNQWTIGAISKLRKTFDRGITTEVGIDWRTASIDHYRDVRDLLGGSYYIDDANEFTGDRQTTFGDKIDYYNTNTVDWLGGYLQVEKSDADGSIYAMFGGAQNAYDFTDHFKKGPDGNELRLNSGNLRGYQIKGGVTRNLTDTWYVFGNAGYVSKVPIFDGAIDDVVGVVNPDPKNETFSSFEAGVKYSTTDRRLTGGLNLYHTTWNDRTLNIYVPQAGPNNEDITANVLGVNERHMGVELQGGYQPSNLFRFDVSASLGNWYYMDDATGRLVSGDRQTAEEYAFYIKDLKVSDQPQTQLVYSASAFPVEGSFLQVQGRTNYRYYAFFDPFGRTSDADREQSWKTPGYTVFDFHGAYRITDLIPAWTGGDVRLFANVFNVFDKMYIQDATDNSSYNGFYGGCSPDYRACAANLGHNAMSAEVYLGLPRTFNLGFEVSF